jgi:transposase InsO family protein
MGIRQVLIAPRAPWQNPFAERVIGSIRRECLDQVIVINERHLPRLLHSYFAYDNATRPHQFLCNDSPHPRDVPTRAARPIRRSADFLTAISALPEWRRIQWLHVTIKR